MLVELRGQLDEVGEHGGARQRGIGHVRQHAVQAVAELVEQVRASSGDSSEGWPSAPLEKLQTLMTRGAISPSSRCWSRSEVIQAPERFEAARSSRRRTAPCAAVGALDLPDPDVGMPDGRPCAR